MPIIPKIEIFRGLPHKGEPCLSKKNAKRSEVEAIESEIRQAVAKNLTEQAAKRETNALQLATETGLSSATVYRAFAGEGDVRLSTVVILSRALKVKLAAITGKEG